MRILKRDIATKIFCGRGAIGDDKQKDTYDTIFIDESLVDQAKKIKSELKKISTSYELEIEQLGPIRDKNNYVHLIWWIKNLPLTRFDLSSLEALRVP